MKKRTKEGFFARSLLQCPKTQNPVLMGPHGIVLRFAATNVK